MADLCLIIRALQLEPTGLDYWRRGRLGDWAGPARERAHCQACSFSFRFFPNPKKNREHARLQRKANAAAHVLPTEKFRACNSLSLSQSCQCRRLALPPDAPSPFMVVNPGASCTTQSVSHSGNARLTSRKEKKKDHTPSPTPGQVARRNMAKDTTQLPV